MKRRMSFYTFFFARGIGTVAHGFAVTLVDSLTAIAFFFAIGDLPIFPLFRTELYTCW